MSQALTPAIVSRATCPSDRLQIDLFDSMVSGLCLRVGRAGKKSWNLMRRVDGKRVRMKLGDASLMSLAEARVAARNVANNRAASSATIASGETFDALVAIFLARAGIKASTRMQYENLIKGNLLPAWRGRVVASIGRKEIFAALDPIVTRGALVTANQVQVLIVALLSVAVERGWIQANVARGIKRVGGPQRSREVSLNLLELAKLWKALDAERPQARDVLRLLILTAARKDEVRKIVWSEVDMLNGYWLIPASRTKVGRERGLQLPPTALKILESIERTTPLIFPDVHKNLAHIVERSCQRAGVPPVTAHDLRRTSATLLASLGVSRTVLRLILGHSARAEGPVAIYDRHSYSLEQSQALTRLDRLIRSELVP